jgi:glycosyltransferase involved in cell wall biosynthesis
VLRAGTGPAAVAGGLARGRAAGGTYDVVHAHLSVFSPFASLVARGAVSAGVPTVLTMHSMVGDRRWVLRTVGRAVGWDHWPAMWTTVSQAAAQDLRQVLPREANVSVVPNATDVSWWAPDDTLVPSPAQPRPVTVLSVMRLVPRKRPLALVSMLAAMRSRVDPAVPLSAQIVGDGPVAARMQEELVRRGLDDWVTMTGALDRVSIRQLCHRADLYVAPATRESFGIAALEARAAGLPIVAMRSGGVRDFVRDGVEGVLADSDEEMAQALAVLAVDRQRRDRIAAHNRAVAPTADWPLVVADVDEVYAAAHDVARSARARPGRPVWRAAASQWNDGLLTRESGGR